MFDQDLRQAEPTVEKNTDSSMTGPKPSVKLITKQPAPPKDGKFFISDHFGLLACFQLKKQDSKRRKSIRPLQLRGKSLRKRQMSEDAILAREVEWKTNDYICLWTKLPEPVVGIIIKYAGLSSQVQKRSLRQNVLRHIPAELFEPSSEDASRFQEALLLLRKVLAQLPVFKVDPIESKRRHTGVEVLCMGSFALGTEGANSDLDLVVVAACDRDDFFARLPLELPAASRQIRIFRVLADGIGSHVGLVELLVLVGGKQVQVDLQYCKWASSTDVPFGGSHKQSSKRLHLETLLRAISQSRMDPKSRLALTGVLDSECILQTLQGLRALELSASFRGAVRGGAWGIPSSSSPQLERFRVLCRTLRIWAKRHDVYFCRYGFPGGLGYSVLCSVFLQQDTILKRSTESLNVKIDCPVSLLRDFFLWLDQQEWCARSVSIDARSSDDYNRLRATGQVHVPYVILAPFSSSQNPFGSNQLRNIVRLATSSSLAALRRAVGLALEAKSWQILLEPSPFSARYSSYICVTVSASRLRSFRRWSKYIESRLGQLTVRVTQVSEEQGPLAPRLLAHVAGSRYISPDLPLFATFLLGLWNCQDPANPTVGLALRLRKKKQSRASRKKLQKALVQDLKDCLQDFETELRSWKYRFSISF